MKFTTSYDDILAALSFQVIIFFMNLHERLNVGWNLQWEILCETDSGADQNQISFMILGKCIITWYTIVFEFLNDRSVLSGRTTKNNVVLPLTLCSAYPY